MEEMIRILVRARVVKKSSLHEKQASDNEICRKEGVDRTNAFRKESLHELNHQLNPQEFWLKQRIDFERHRDESPES